MHLTAEHTMSASASELPGSVRGARLVIRSAVITQLEDSGPLPDNARYPVLSQIETLPLRGRDRGEVRDNVSLDLDMLLHGISQTRPPGQQGTGRSSS